MKPVLRPVSSGEYPAARRLWRECFPEDSEAFIAFFFNRCTGPEHVLAAFDGQTMVGALHCFYGQVRFFSQRKAAVFLSGVGTAQKARNQGVAAALLREAHRRAYERGACAALLQPFSFPFYRRFGYGVLSRHVRRTALPGGSLHLKEPDGRTLYAWSEACRHDGWFYRSLQDCENVLEDAAISGDLALAAREGYALCQREEGRLVCYEALGSDVPALCAAVAAREGCPVEYDLPEEPAGEAGEPFGMLRILNVEEFLQGAPIGRDGGFVLEEEDCPWQQGGYWVGSLGGRAQLTRRAAQEDWPRLMPETLAELAAGTCPGSWFVRRTSTFAQKRY